MTEEDQVVMAEAPQVVVGRHLPEVRGVLQVVGRHLLLETLGAPLGVGERLLQDRQESSGDLMEVMGEEGARLHLGQPETRDEEI